jgi:hypothetical protein
VGPKDVARLLPASPRQRTLPNAAPGLGRRERCRGSALSCGGNVRRRALLMAFVGAERALLAQFRFGIPTRLSARPRSSRCCSWLGRAKPAATALRRYQQFRFH